MTIAGTTTLPFRWTRCVASHANDEVERAVGVGFEDRCCKVKGVGLGDHQLGPSRTSSDARHLPCSLGLGTGPRTSSTGRVGEPCSKCLRVCRGCWITDHCNGWRAISPSLDRCVEEFRQQRFVVSSDQPFVDESTQCIGHRRRSPSDCSADGPHTAWLWSVKEPERDIEADPPSSGCPRRFGDAASAAATEASMTSDGRRMER